ncbi:threonylcarbamoyl-AMP synthase [Candidatus Parcubacteria bacterium]|nr:threonylcarbamoyl-AMP synthase [Patescibacteria group bacterium]MCG2694092.1 threonylcarbamoyl-AMP synthase [Candidatus Parcubacteria bacterium]
MRVLSINKKNIAEAVKILKDGGTVVYPTETSYGLGCDWENSRAIAKIAKIKQRPKEKKFAVICANKAMTARFFKFGKLEKQLATEYWPGPLGIVLSCLTKGRIAMPRKPCNPPLCQVEVAVRVSSNDIARALSRGLKKPIISTSANISGKGDPYDIKTIIKSFENQKYQPDLILDAGRLPLRKSSTIIKITKNGKIEILREGEIRI